MVYTEFVSAEALVRSIKSTVNKLTVCDEERPVGIQIYGRDAEAMVEAAKIVEDQAHPDVIDINFGCPVKKVASKGAGAGMLQNIPKLLDITRQVVKAVSTPVTVKTRLGWSHEQIVMGNNPTDPYLVNTPFTPSLDSNPASTHIADLTERLQDCGIQALTIHGRTRAQMYRGEADWTLIGKVKNNPLIKIPIIGNGDVDSAEKAALMFDRYGVDGVMIGRATYGRPWIFKECKHYMQTGELLPQPSVVERVQIAKEHLAKSLEVKGDYVGILEMRRHLTNYFKGLPDFKPTRMKLVTSLDPEEMYTTLDYVAERWGDYDFSQAVPAPLSHDI